MVDKVPLSRVRIGNKLLSYKNVKTKSFLMPFAVGEGDAAPGRIRNNLGAAGKNPIGASIFDESHSIDYVLWIVFRVNNAMPFTFISLVCSSHFCCLILGFCSMRPFAFNLVESSKKV